MKIGIPRERKPDENRVALTPSGVRELTARGGTVLIERDAGVGSGFSDAAYEKVGATLTSRDQVWTDSKLIVKVKEPLPEEFGYLRDDLALLTYLHLAADRALRSVAGQPSHRDWVRDGATGGRPPAASSADERSGGQARSAR